MYRHRIDPIALVFGAAFLAIALLVGLPEEPWTFIINDLAIGWLWPVLLIVVGAAVLIPSLRTRSEADSEDIPEEPQT
jgi:uncharacterized membrane protein